MELTPELLAQALAQAVQPIADRVEELSSAVAALQEGSGILRDQAPEAQPIANLTAVTRAPLVLCEDEAKRQARFAIADAHNLPPELWKHFMDFGGRGLYRDVREHIKGLSRAAIIAIIMDAQGEDVREAQQMGADLLKVWAENGPPPADA